MRMPEKQNRTKTASINLRVEPEFKVAAERAAAADRRTLTSYIEKLIDDDLAARKAAPAPRKRWTREKSSRARKKTRRPARAEASVKSLLLPADLAERIDRWAKRNGKDSHSEAMRHLLELGLKAPTPQDSHAPAQLSKAAINQIADRTVERSDAMQRKAGRAPKRKSSK
jgi:Ribbon-helix-helix protein, copG family